MSEPVKSPVIAGREAVPIERLIGERPIVYRLYDRRRRLLYVGMTITPLGQRLVSHRGWQTWWPEVAYVTSDEFPTKEAATWAERLAIQAEKPLRNEKRPRVQLDLPIAGIRRAQRRSPALEPSERRAIVLANRRAARNLTLVEERSA